jgi:AmiR/NasT family two-component response regulator
MSSFRGARVLVVEDEAMLSLELEAMLLDMGCVIVGTAAKLDDALRISRSWSSMWPFSTSTLAANAWTL